MKVLAAADIHGNWDTYNWLVEATQTHHPDLMLLAGDLLGGGHGSKALADLFQRTSVRAHIHGHSHQSFGRSGCHFNVAAGYKRRAMLIDVAQLDRVVIEHV